MSIKTFAFSLLTLAACATAAQAQTTVLDNLSSFSGNTITGSSNNTMVAQAFVAGTSSTTLLDVMFPQILQGPASGTYYNGYSSSETFSLYSNNPATGLPLASLVSLTVQPGSGSNTVASSSTAGDETVATVPSDAVSQAAATLLAGTKYWLVLSSATTVSWDYTASTTSISNLGFSLPATGAASEVGATTYALTGGPQEIYLSVVPEPSTYCLMAVAGLALVIRRKRSVKMA